MIKELQNIAIETDNKAVRKQVGEQIERLIEESTFKLKCLKNCLNGFNVKDYLDARAKAAIDKVEIKNKPKERSVSSKIPNGELYNTLKAWRADKAEDLGVDQYMIIPQKTLLQLVVQLPYSMAELRTIKGIGKKKIQQFGSEILDIIKEYRIDNNIETPQSEIEETPIKKSKKRDTKRISFELYKSGKSIKDIAQERSMSLMTIEGHIAHFVGTGELDVTLLLTKDKIDLISDYFINSKTKLLSAAKADLGDKVTYSELKFVLKHLDNIGNF
jgi:citrate lyase gamma subunit